MMNAELLKFFDDLKTLIISQHEQAQAFIDDFLAKYDLPLHVGNEWTHDVIEWDPVEGPRDPYLLAVYQDNHDFRLLTRDLDAAGGKLKHGNYFYWTFDRSAKIGAKPIDET